MRITFYWHDYETSGVDTRRDRPLQFAGLRTDEELNEIGEPLVIYCKPSRDILPHPEACLLTGITPQLADAQGIIEPEFIAQIHAEMAQPNTCSVGYNTLRFDDEVTRYTLYRNFYDPYAREWQNGNSRWDLIDLARMTYALRPEGIVWPKRDDGKPSFRLEELTAANGIGHESAHDALSDVRATIGLARLIRDRQPRLYNWLFQLRNKRKAKEQLDTVNHKPVLHTSGMYPAEIGCTSLVMPMVAEPRNNNGILVYDLRQDPTPFLGLDVDSLHGRLFTRTEDLPEGVQRLPVKSVKINKCPALAPQNIIDESVADRISLDMDACIRHWQLLSGNIDFMQRIAEAYGMGGFKPAEDVELALYDGFLNDIDRPLLEKVRNATPEELSQAKFDFKDKRLPELLFRYRARNWPETLSQEESQKWVQYYHSRIQGEGGDESSLLEKYYDQIAKLRSMREGDNKAQEILDAMVDWGEIVKGV